MTLREVIINIRLIQTNKNTCYTRKFNQKRATAAKSAGKTRVSQVTIGFGLLVIGWKKNMFSVIGWSTCSEVLELIKENRKRAKPKQTHNAFDNHKTIA